jgi:hypothetical protein
MGQLHHDGGPSHRQTVTILPALAALLCLTIYIVTLVPEVGWGDSAELALQAFQLGVTHPPGYPVHTFLGHFIGFLIPEPALATNVLSLVCTSMAVGVVGWMVLRMTAKPAAAAAAALAFGLSPLIWEKAVITEIYNVNVCFLAVALALALAWHQGTARGLPWAAALVFGLSLGTYLANLLFLPAFLFLIATRKRQRGWTLSAAFVLLTTIVGAVVLSWSALRSTAVVPLGTTYVPDTLPHFLRYLSGIQYGTAAIQTPGFYLQRIAEHSLLFAKNFLGVGVLLGLLGLWRLWREQRAICFGLLIIFVVNFGYFTGYQTSDYSDMVTPAYLVFSLWIGCGLAFLLAQPRATVKALGFAVSLALLGGLLVWQLPARLARSHSTQVTDFVMSSFEVLPENAVAISAWPKFAPMLYFQRVHNQRPDLTLIERKAEPRHYANGTAGTWWDYASSLPASTPLFIDLIKSGPPDVHLVESINSDWQQITVNAGSH